MGLLVAVGAKREQQDCVISPSCSLLRLLGSSYKRAQTFEAPREKPFRLQGVYSRSLWKMAGAAAGDGAGTLANMCVCARGPFLRARERWHTVTACCVALLYGQIAEVEGEVSGVMRRLRAGTAPGDGLCAPGFAATRTVDTPVCACAPSPPARCVVASPHPHAQPQRGAGAALRAVLPTTQGGVMALCCMRGVLLRHTGRKS